MFEPNVWVKIAAEDTVTITLTMLEMGHDDVDADARRRGLDIDWKNLKTVWAPADAESGNPNFGGQH